MLWIGTSLDIWIVPSIKWGEIRNQKSGRWRMDQFQAGCVEAARVDIYSKIFSWCQAPPTLFFPKAERRGGGPKRQNFLKAIQKYCPTPPKMSPKPLLCLESLRVSDIIYTTTDIGCATLVVVLPSLMYWFWCCHRGKVSITRTAPQ